MVFIFMLMKNILMLSKMKQKKFQNYPEECPEKLKELLENFPENWETCDFSDIISELSYYLDLNFFDYDDNYAFSSQINSEGEIDYSEHFEGCVYLLTSGSPNIFKPEFSSKEEVLEDIKKYFYIPEDYDAFDNGNVIFLTGVQGG